MDTKIEHKERNYGLDLFKILCMFFVIAFHFSDHGRIAVSCAQKVTFNWCVLSFSRIFGAICNCAFMLVSGYFLYQKKFSVKNIFRLWLQVWAYSVGIGIFCFLIGTQKFYKTSLVHMLFPFTFNQYWFFSTYIVVYLFFPFLNRLIDSLSQKQHQALIFLGIFFFSFFYTVTASYWIMGTNFITIFFVLYFIGAYINKYKVSLPRKKLLLMSAAFILLEIASIFARRIYFRFSGNDDFAYFIWGTDKILPVITTILLFLLFKDLKIEGKWLIRLIEFTASSVFGVYLLHIGRLHAALFQKIFDNSRTYDTVWLLPQMLAAMFSIFAAGILADKLRILIFERPVLKLLSAPLEKLNAFVQKFYH